MGYRELVSELLKTRAWKRRLLACAVAAIFAAVPAVAQEAVIVVHSETEITSVTSAELSKIFLRQLRTWESGEPARPVDQVPGPLREAFSRAVHGRSVITIEVYWRRMIFSGRAVPPPEVANDDAVLEYVRSTTGSVGYVSAGADLDDVRILDVEE